MFKSKKKYSLKFYQACAVMVGYIIGVGMFGLPYITAKAGIVTFLIFLISLGLIQYLIHLVYANMIVVTHEYHRLPGYAGKYIGPKGKTIAFIAKLVGNYGALLAYFIITGIFLNEILSPVIGGSEFLYTTIVFVISAAIVYFGIGMIAEAELFMSALLFIVIIAISWRGISYIDAANFSSINWTYFLLPYGAMLMALDGNGSLPIVAKLLKKDKEQIKQVIRISMLVATIITALFVITIVGITGSATTADALVGVKSVLSDIIIYLALIFGVITMFTSILGVSEAVKETLWWDYKVPKTLAWALAMFVPYIGFLLGMRNLIKVISFAGGVAGGCAAIILVLIFYKLKKKRNKLVLFKYKPADWMVYILFALFGAGIIYEFLHFIKSFS